MNSYKEFLSIVSFAFNGYEGIKLYNDFPLAYKNICKVFSIDFDGETHLVICFDDTNHFYDALLLYVYLKKEYKKTFIYVSKAFKNVEKEKLVLLLRKHISFIDDVGGVYSYFGKINYLEESFKEIKEESDTEYTKKTQLVFKYYFFNKKKNYPVREIAEALGISASSVSRANETLSRIGVLDKNGYGKNTAYLLVNKRKALNLLKPYFIKPFEKEYFLALDDVYFETLSPKLLSSEYALSEYTDLLPSSKSETFAVDKNKFVPFYNAYLSVEINNPTHFVSIQPFIYNPSLFSDGKTIDLIDLYIIMLKDEDLRNPRVMESFKEIERKLLNE